MAILKANILAFVNKALKITETDIDVEIQVVLDDLSEEDFLEASDNSETLASGTASFSVPTDFRDYSAITLTNVSGVNQDPLQVIPGGIEEYRAVKSNDFSTGTPHWYALFNDTVNLWRPSSGVFTVLQEYTKDHPRMLIILSSRISSRTR